MTTELMRVAREALPSLLASDRHLSPEDETQLLRQASAALPGPLIDQLEREGWNEPLVQSVIGRRLENLLAFHFCSEADLVALRKQMMLQALRMVRNREIADDLVQETLARVLQRRELFRGDSSYQVWALKILFFRFRDRARGSREVSLEALAERLEGSRRSDNERTLSYVLDRPDPAPIAEASLLDREKATKILATCQGLFREGLVARAFNLVYVQEVPPDEAAQAMGITRNHLYTLCHKIRSTMRRAPQLQELMSP